jgi:hypothetical protein
MDGEVKRAEKTNLLKAEKEPGMCEASQVICHGL